MVKINYLTEFSSKWLPMMLLSGAVFISGCATTGPIRGAATSNALYTNASIEEAFNASTEALQTIGYNLSQIDSNNHFISGSFTPPWDNAPLIAQLHVSQETSGAKIVYSLDQFGKIKELDFLGYYQQKANDIYLGINKILSSKGYKVQKSG